jgi:hypothetical protein
MSPTVGAGLAPALCDWPALGDREGRPYDANSMVDDFIIRASCKTEVLSEIFCCRKAKESKQAAISGMMWFSNSTP